jgi:hypothetical protein
VLYETNVCMKLFNRASPKFGERGGTNREACLPFTKLHKKRRGGLSQKHQKFVLTIRGSHLLNLEVAVVTLISNGPW